MKRYCLPAACLLLLALAASAQADGSETVEASIMQTAASMPDLLEQTAISEAMRGYWRQVLLPPLLSHVGL